MSGNLVLKNKLPPQSGSVAFRQLNPTHKKGPYFFLMYHTSSSRYVKYVLKIFQTKIMKNEIV